MDNPAFHRRITEMTAAHIQQWIAYAMKMECRRCGENIFADEDEAREAAMALLEAGYKQPPVLREYHSVCDYCDHMLSKDD
jgi:hypothetical protein